MSSDRPKIWICDGKHCRKRQQAQSSLQEELGGLARIEPVRCQKICDGPVVGVKIDGTHEWFESLDTPKSRAALRRLLETKELKKPLWKRLVRKRSGQLRK